MLENIFGIYFVEHFWRLIYCLISFYLLYYLAAAYIVGPEDYKPLFEYPLWLMSFMAVGKIFGLIVNYWGFVQLDYFEFWGLRQAYRGIINFRKKDWKPMELFGVQRLEVSGIYKFCRHPALAGGFFFIVFTLWTKAVLVYGTYYTIYMFIGAYYEEKRLIKHFGDQYLEYRKQVGAFFPNTRQIYSFFSGRSVPIALSQKVK